MSTEQLLGLTERYLRKVGETVSILAKEKKGGEAKGAVAGRPVTEDVEIGVDRKCDEVFKDLLQSSRLSIQVFSEHGSYFCGKGSPRYYCAIDPFDGSGLYRRGFEFEWYSVLTFFDLQCEPLAGGAIDILNKKIYLADCSKSRCFLLENREQRIVLSRRRKKIIDNTTWIAAYVMVSDYYLPLMRVFEKLWKKFPNFRLWPNGGAGIYHQIAAGKVHAYIMPNEPCSEIDPGLSFAKAADFPVVSVKQDGSYESYQFMPGRQEDRVDFFITASTDELVQTILREIT